MHLLQNDKAMNTAFMKHIYWKCIKDCVNNKCKQCSTNAFYYQHCISISIYLTSCMLKDAV